MKAFNAIYGKKSHALLFSSIYIGLTEEMVRDFHITSSLIKLLSVVILFLLSYLITVIGV